MGKKPTEEEAGVPMPDQGAEVTVVVMWVKLRAVQRGGREGGTDQMAST